MPYTYAALKSDYENDLSAMALTATRQAAAEAKTLLRDRSRFLRVQARCGVPALWIIPVFYRERPSFNAYLGNGDPLNRPTVHVPKGRGPFDRWEDGAVDALVLDKITLVQNWSWPLACYEWELWNGFGPRMHHRSSGYVWAGTTIYHGGKYVADGVWSPGTWDQQLGCVALGKAIAALDPEIGSAFEQKPRLGRPKQWKKTRSRSG